jgi:hypothetical protein
MSGRDLARLAFSAITAGKSAKKRTPAPVSFAFQRVPASILHARRATRMTLADADPAKQVRKLLTPPVANNCQQGRRRHF